MFRRKTLKGKIEHLNMIIDHLCRETDSLRNQFREIAAERDELKKRDQFFRAALVQTQGRVAGLEADLRAVHQTLAQHGKVVAAKVKRERRAFASHYRHGQCPAKVKLWDGTERRCIMGLSAGKSFCRVHSLHIQEPELFDNGTARE